MPRVTMTCKALGVDYAVAMTGFEVRGGQSVPKFDGVVVCEEHEAAVVDAYWAAERYVPPPPTRRVCGLLIRVLSALSGHAQQPRRHCVLCCMRVSPGGSEGGGGGGGCQLLWGCCSWHGRSRTRSITWLAPQPCLLCGDAGLLATGA